MHAGFPDSPVLKEYQFTYKCQELMVKLYEEFNLVIAVTFFDDKPWIRLSANVYNHSLDFQEMITRMASALKIQL